MSKVPRDDLSLHFHQQLIKNGVCLGLNHWHIPSQTPCPTTSAACTRHMYNMVKCCSSHEEECRFPTKTQCRMMTQILVPGCKFPRIQHAISQNLKFLIICQRLQTYNNTILVGNANFFWSHLTGCNLAQNLVYEIECLCYPPLSRYYGSQKCYFPIRNNFCASVFSFPQCYIHSPSSEEKTVRSRQTHLEGNVYKREIWIWVLKYFSK